jgi:hypothetical protein
MSPGPALRLWEWKELQAATTKLQAVDRPACRLLALYAALLLQPRSSEPRRSLGLRIQG